jgi:membrane-bound lytic murein transglycosylase MltF
MRQRILQLILVLSLGLSSPIKSFEIAPFITQARFTGDWDVIKKRGVLRVLVSADLGFYYLDNGHPEGAIANMLSVFEWHLLKQTNYGIRLEVIPVTRDLLLPALVNGIGDIAASNLTVTPYRKNEVNFSTPILSGINEYLISKKDTPPITKLSDLAHKAVWVRPSASYYHSLLKLNVQLKQQGLSPMRIHFLEETLQDFEVLEMLQAEMIDLTVLDSDKADFWKQVMKDLRFHSQFPIRKNASISWAFRQQSPQLTKLINTFIENNRIGTVNGNLIYNRYLKRTDWFEKLINPQNVQQFKVLEKSFTHFAERYQLNWLMLTAQAYQESGLDQNQRSSVGAIGIMQVMPQTAKEPYINIPDIYNVNNNIHAGAKYMRFIIDNYFNDQNVDKMNQFYFALASYNAGPTRIRNLRKKAKAQGFDPNLWFNNVDIVVRQHVGIQPITYVGNIYRYYTIYRQIYSLNNSALQVIPFSQTPTVIPSH